MIANIKSSPFKSNELYQHKVVSLKSYEKYRKYTSVQKQKAQRSNSVFSVKSSEQNQQILDDGEIKHRIVRKIQRLPSKSIPIKRANSQLEIQKNVSYHSLLSHESGEQTYQNLSLPINNYKDLELLMKTNSNIKKIIEESKDQKVKINKILLSNRNKEKEKVSFIQNKNDELKNMIQKEIQTIYTDFFQKQYLQEFGQKDGKDIFESRINNMAKEMSTRIFKK